jgi:hypothetical protein
MALGPEDTAPILRFLSPERLSALHILTGSYEAAIELHQETLRLGSALMHVTATIEIALRNSICENLSHHFGVPNWLTQTPVHFKWRDPERKKITSALDSARRANYAKLSQAEKSALDNLAYPNGRQPNTSHLQRAKDRRNRIIVSEGKVIAELTLYFWKRLYGPEYDQSLWRTTLKKTFPHKKLKRAEIATQLEQIYQSRNRLAHHEPVLHKRFLDTMNAIQFVLNHLEADVPSTETPLAKLLENDFLEVKERAAILHDRLNAYRIH